MDQIRWQQIGTIVDQALGLDTPEERAALVKQLCGDDEILRKEVTDWLDSIASSKGLWNELLLSNQVLMDDMTMSGAPALPESPGELPDQIGLYKIKKRLGRGGMGDVFLAERSEGDFHDNVALKVMRHEVGSTEQVRRFLQERTMLSGLNHPNIARLLDGGVSEGGRPYYIMEYVDGLPMTKYCEKHSCSLKERLALFGQVCRAVQYAHSNFIVHRDLKPDNLLVTADGTLKVLDFGIAKLVDQELSEKRLLQTQAGQRMLSLHYAAPEQITMQAVTTATDVYALGLLLYELLAESRPFDLTGKNLVQAEQIIREQEPGKPSAAATKWYGKLSGDLDAIILKALRKEPDQRYESASRLWEDVERYLKSRPVLARKGTLRYRAGKFFRRHKTGVIASIIIFLSIAGLIGFYTYQINEERELAQIEATKANEIANYLSSLFSKNYPEISQGKEITADQLLNEGANQINTLDGQPEVKLSMLNLFASINHNLENLEKADSLANEAVKLNKRFTAPNKKELAASYHVLALVNRDWSNLGKSIEHFKKSLELEGLTKTDADTNYAARLSSLAFVLRQNDELHEAAAKNDAAIRIQERIYGKANIKLAESLYIQAAILKTLGRFNEAMRFQLKSYNMVKELVEPPHPGLAANLSNLALLEKETGDLDSAEKFNREALEMYTALYGENYSMVANCLSNLAKLLSTKGNVTEALNHYRKALKIRRKIFGENDLQVAYSYNEIGNLYVETDNFEKGDSLLNTALKLKIKEVGEHHLTTSYTYANLARLEQKRGQVDKAYSYAEKALSIRLDKLGENHPETEEVKRFIVKLKPK